MPNCKYPSCANLAEGRITGPALCIFHLPAEKKGISPKDLAVLIEKQYSEGNYNFEGYIFTCTVDFHGKEFASAVNFRGCHFLGADELINWPTESNQLSHTPRGSADFRKCVFAKDADFANAKFEGGLADFGDAQFCGTETNFSGSRFMKDRALFNRAQFKGHYAGFRETDFSQVNALFWETDFGGMETNFSGATFGDLNFAQTRFTALRSLFVETRFNKDTLFYSAEMPYAVEFIDLILGDHSHFYFRNIRFRTSGAEQSRVVFDGVVFRPFASHFEDIPWRGSANVVENATVPVLLFRHCQLKDVYFSNDSLSFFSFYTSSIDEAHFISSTWQELTAKVLRLDFRRKNIIGDELLLSRLLEVPEEKREYWNREYRIDNSYHFKEVAGLYRTLKTALDRTKDYTQASWLYFNEFEMLRIALSKELFEVRRYKRLADRGRLLLYNFYRVIAGYGEKPLWSSIWFCIATFLFGCIHLLSGLASGNTVVANYDVCLSIQGLTNLSTIDFLARFLDDYGTSLVFALFRLIPVVYVPPGVLQVTPVGTDGILWSFLNSVVLILLVTLTGIGLKRHFRRF